MVTDSVEEYLNLRVFTGGVFPSFALLLLPLDIPEHILEGEKVRKLERLGNEMISVANVRECRMQ